MSNYTLKVFKWASLDELTVKELSYDNLQDVWDFLGSEEGKASEGVKLYNSQNEIVFALNHDVHTSPARANDCK